MPVACKTHSIHRCRQFLLEIDDFLDLRQKPGVDLGELENLLNGEAGAEGVAEDRFHFARFALRLRAAR